MRLFILQRFWPEQAGRLSNALNQTAGTYSLKEILSISQWSDLKHCRGGAGRFPRVVSLSIPPPLYFYLHILKIARNKIPVPCPSVVVDFIILFSVQKEHFS